MFVRFVRLAVRQDRLADMRRFYADRVVPTLQRMEGCVFASLLEPSRESFEALSVTLWESREAAERYEASGVYDELLDESDEFLMMPGASSLPDPTVEGYTVGGDSEMATPDEPQRPLFVRMVAMRVELGRLDELRERYTRRVAPALRETAGCRDAYLLTGLGGRSRVLSVTFWDREEDAVRYELSGAFDRLVGVLRDCLSDIEQWRLALAAEATDGPVARRGLDVSGFRVVAAHRMKP